MTNDPSKTTRSTAPAPEGDSRRRFSVAARLARYQNQLSYTRQSQDYEDDE